MSALKVDAVEYDLSPNGRLADLSEWNEDVANALAEKEGIRLTDEHWEILCLMRIFYQDYNLSPVRKLLKKAIAERLDPNNASDAYLDELFPDSVEIQGTRIAGIPEPLLDAELERTRHATDQIFNPGRVAHFIDEFSFEGKTYAVHPCGNLVNPEQWNEHLAEFMAGKEGLLLMPEHWEVIYFLRRFYLQYGISPMVRLMMRHMRGQFGPEKSGEDYLYELFPGGPSRQGSRVAGLPEPQGCVDP